MYGDKMGTMELKVHYLTETLNSLSIQIERLKKEIAVLDKPRAKYQYICNNLNSSSYNIEIADELSDGDLRITMNYNRESMSMFLTKQNVSYLIEDLQGILHKDTIND